MKSGLPHARNWPGILTVFSSWALGLGAAWQGGQLLLDWVAWSNRGFEFNDEGMSFLVAQDPWRNIHASLFGYALHPLFQLVGQDPGGYRIAAMVLALLTGAGLAWMWVQAPWVGADARGYRLPWFVFLLSGSLLLFSGGIRTPSYNFLVVVGAMWAWTGVLRAQQLGGFSWGASFLLVAGVVACAFGKWVVGILLGICLGVVLAGRPGWSAAGACKISGLLLVALLGSAFWIGWDGLVQAWQEARFTVLGGSHGVHLLSYYFLTLLNFFYRILRAFAYGLPLLVLLWWWCSRKKSRPFPGGVPGAWLLPWLILLAGCFFGQTMAGASSFSRVGSNVVTEGMWLMAASLIVLGRPLWPRPGPDPKTVGAVVLTPFLLGVGTSTALGDYVGLAGIFFQMAGSVFWLNFSRRGVSPHLLSAFLWVAVLFNLFRCDAALRDQFRTRPMEECNRAWVIPGGTRVLVDPGQESLLHNLFGVLSRGGFRPGDPVVAIDDMSGLVYLLGGWSPGTALYRAAHPSSLRYAWAALESARPQDRHGGFLLVRERCFQLDTEGKIPRLAGRAGVAPEILGPWKVEDSETRIYFWPP